MSPSAAASQLAISRLAAPHQSVSSPWCSNFVKTVIISSEFPPGPGGVGTHAFELAAGIASMGWGVEVITRQDYVSEQERVQFNHSSAVTIHSLVHQSSLLKDLYHRFMTAAAVIRRAIPNVIVATGNARVVLLGVLLSRLYRIPCVAIGHGTEFGVQSIMARMIMRTAYNSVECVVCVSEFTKQYMVRSGVKPKKVVVIPNGANAMTFRILDTEAVNRFREAHGLLGRKVLVTVGNVTDRKGQDIVVNALSQVVSQYPDVLYVIIGLPTQRDKLQKEINSLGLNENVRFVGRISDNQLVGYLNAALIHIMTSRHTSSGDFEGYGIAVVEAALCGTPSIVASNSGLVEAVDYGESGVIVPENDPSATAQAVASLLGDSAALTALSNRASVRALNEKTWANRVTQYHQLLGDFVQS